MKLVNVYFYYGSSVVQLYIVAPEGMSVIQYCECTYELWTLEICTEQENVTISAEL